MKKMKRINAKIDEVLFYKLQDRDFFKYDVDGIIEDLLSAYLKNDFTIYMPNTNNIILAKHNK